MGGEVGRGMRENDEGDESKIRCKHIHKCHNETTLYN
jgi:hypothetical protein